MKRTTILAVLALLLFASCSRERPETVFRTLDTGFCDLPTRSLLTAPDIETKKTSVTLAAYTDGTLAASGHYQSGLDALVLNLEPGRTYTVYALVNMGDMTASIPRSESELASLTYRIPSYTEGTESLAARGLPMAGKLTWPGQGTSIPVERLLAKVTAHLSCEWEGAAIRSVHVRNLNRVLRPFGEAVMAEDWDQQEFHAGTGTASGTFVFYVPENRQGTIDGIRMRSETGAAGSPTWKRRWKAPASMRELLFTGVSWDRMRSRTSISGAMPGTTGPSVTFRTDCNTTTGNTTMT